MKIAEHPAVIDDIDVTDPTTEEQEAMGAAESATPAPKAKAPKAPKEPKPDKGKKAAKPPKAESKPKAAKPKAKAEYSDSFARGDTAVKVAVEEIVVLDEVQCRAGLDKDQVEQYRADIEEGDPLPVIELVNTADGRLILSSGSHRLQAQKDAGFKEVQAIIHKGTLEDAFLRGLETNRQHGLPLNRRDKQRTIDWFLANHRGMSDREIARRVGCNKDTIHERRHLMYPKAPKPGPVAESATLPKVAYPDDDAERPGIDPADTDAMPLPSANGTHEPDPVKVEGPAMTPTKFLESLGNTASKLTNTARERYERDALRYHRITEDPRYKPFFDMLKREINGNQTRDKDDLWYNLFRKLLNIPHPRDAKVCPDCGGSGHTKDGQPHDVCKGRGYFVAGHGK